MPRQIFNLQFQASKNCEKLQSQILVAWHTSSPGSTLPQAKTAGSWLMSKRPSLISKGSVMSRGPSLVFKGSAPQAACSSIPSLAPTSFLRSLSVIWMPSVMVPVRVSWMSLQTAFQQVNRNSFLVHSVWRRTR